MSFLERLRRVLGGQAGKSSSGGRSRFGDDPNAYWIYAQCRRCGEPLKARINLMNDLSETEDGEGWIVRKGLVGTGANRCFQTVEVTLTFDRQKQNVIASEVAGGRLLTVQEYEALTRVEP
ncbi:MAG: hypothetical protein ACPL88_10300 [Bryobacteraceae bacterium]